MEKLPKVALIWDNFGPLHDDRLAACVHDIPEAAVTGVELAEKSDTYSWDNVRAGNVHKQTLFRGIAMEDISFFAIVFRLGRHLFRGGYRYLFFCHYENPAITLLAFLFRLCGRKVFFMACSKFDDKPRHAVKEFLKSFFLMPYHGGLVGSARSVDYYTFLTNGHARLVQGYNTVSNDRIRENSRGTNMPEAEFQDRDFLLIARLVPKKNISLALQAYAKFRKAHPDSCRRLAICGDGPLEAQLKAETVALGIEAYVVFHGFLQTKAISGLLANALALLLVSTEEQFGNVVPEALAMDIPLLLTDVCGARYDLLRTGKNGFMVEADNPEALAMYMGQLSEDAVLWQQLRVGCHMVAPAGDTCAFSAGVRALMGLTPPVQ